MVAARSSDRRPGFSRRARLGVFAGYVTAITGALVGLALVLIAAFDPQGFAALRGLFGDAGAPVSASGRGAIRPARSLDEWLAAYWDAGAQNRELRAEIEANRRRLIEAEAIALENRRLRGIVGLIEREPRVVVTAQLVNSSLTSSRRFATLFAGSTHGVRVGQPVRSADGLIGRIVETGRITSRVLLITDRANIVPIEISRDGTPGFTTGRGDGTVDIRSLEAGSNPFRRGDVVITSGTGGIYPPNVPVAVVTRVFGDSALGAPLADPGALDFAVVSEAYEVPVEPAAEAAPAAPASAPAP